MSTVAAGFETLDFLEPRKTTTTSARDESGNRQLDPVLPEKQTNMRGLIGSEHGYDVSGVSDTSVPVLKEERGTRVRCAVRHRLSTDHIISFTLCSARRGVDVSLDVSELEGLSKGLRR